MNLRLINFLLIYCLYRNTSIEQEDIIMKSLLLTTAFVAAIIATASTVEASMIWPYSYGSSVDPRTGELLRTGGVAGSSAHARVPGYAARPGDKVLRTYVGPVLVNEFDARKIRPASSHLADERAGARPLWTATRTRTVTAR